MNNHRKKFGKILMFVGGIFFIYLLGLAHLIPSELPYSKAVNWLILIMLFLLSAGIFVVGYHLHFSQNPVKKSGGKEKQEKERGSGSTAAPETRESKPDPISFPKEKLDDVSFIRDMHHTAAGAWQQYDFLLAARGYGWGYMVDTADYMTGADLDNIGTLTTAQMANMPETDLISQYEAHGKKIREIPELAEERGQLAIGGMSRALGGCPVKIVWYNQTKVFRIFTIPDDEEMMLRYAETVVRRTFGTPDAMKLAKPVPAADPA